MGVLVAPLVSVESLDLKDHLATLEPLEELVPLEIKVLLDNKVTLENQVDQEVRELAEMLDVRDLKEKQVCRVCLDYPENLVNLEHKDQLELQDLLVSPETEVTQVFLELLECRVIVVQLAWLENLENKEDQVLQGTVVHPEILDLSDHLDRLEKVVQKDPLEKSVHQDVMVLQELRENLEQLDQLVLLGDREFPDHQVFQVSKERADLVVMQEHLVFKDLQDQKVAVGRLDQPEFVEIKERQEK